MFSATFSSEIRQLADRLLNRPELIEVARRNATVESIAQVVHPVDKHRKREMLSHMIGARDWRQVLVFTRTKHGANRLAQQLEKDGLAEDTIVFHWSDHGPLPRGKRWPYDSGIHVPLIVRFPKKYQHLAPSKSGSVTERLVSFVDFGPTVLSLAGVTIPEHMQGKAFLGPQKTHQPHEYIFGARDRMDERYEFIRSVMDGRFHYIRNYYPHLPWFHDEIHPTNEGFRKVAAVIQKRMRDEGIWLS